MLSLSELLKDPDKDLIQSSGVIGLVLEAFEPVIKLRYAVFNSEDGILDASPGFQEEPLPQELLKARLEETDPILFPHSKGRLYALTRLELEDGIFHRVVFKLESESSLERTADLARVLAGFLRSACREFRQKQINQTLKTRLNQYQSEKRHLQVRYEQIALENLRVRQEIELANKSLERDKQITEEKFHSLFKSAPMPQILLHLNSCRDWLKSQSTTQIETPDQAASLLSLIEIVHTNQATSQLFGLSSTMKIGSFWLDLIPLSSRIPLAQHFYQTVTGQEVDPLQISVLTQEGHHRDVLIQCGRLDEDGMTCCLSIVDLTERIQMERGLIEAKSQAEIANRAKGEFLAVISHELRTPLNGIMGFASLLADTSLKEQQQNYLGFIQQSGNQLYAVVSDILDFVRLETGDFAFEPAFFRLRSTLDSVMAEFLPLARQKSLSLNYILSPEVPDEIEQDREILLKILKALLSNALKFTEHGGVFLEVGLLQDETRITYLSLSVQDSGVGMAAETIEQLFHPFTQADSSSTRSAEGIGMGLTISRKLAELAGARIRVKSQLQEGSRFTIELPLGPAEPSPIKPLEDLSHIKVLVAEDSLTNSAILKEMLKRSGIQAEFCTNGQELLNLYSRTLPHLILTDVYMPVMGGVEACEAIRALEQESGHKSYIVAVSASVTMKVQKRCLQAGADAFLPKPLHQEELRDILLEASAQSKPKSFKNE